MKKFEYKTFQKKLSVNELNDLGEHGWELVTHSVAHSSSLIGSTFAQYYVFKREKIQ